MNNKSLGHSDTTFVAYRDSATVIKQNKEHIILIQDQKKIPEKDWYENIIITSLILPLLVATIGAWFVYALNSKRNKAEVDKLKGETSNLKKTFQPIVIGTLQSIQDKIINSKIDALKGLVKVRNEFSHHKQQYCEGDPIVPDYENFLELLFYNFSYTTYSNYKDFHDSFSYLFPDKVFNILNELLSRISHLNETKKSFNSIGDPDLEPSTNDRKDIENIIKLFDKAILAIREDCHLDTSLIHDFIQNNKV